MQTPVQKDIISLIRVNMLLSSYSRLLELMTIRNLYRQFRMSASRMISNRSDKNFHSLMYHQLSYTAFLLNTQKVVHDDWFIKGSSSPCITFDDFIVLEFLW
jgi:hypothetical protein